MTGALPMAKGRPKKGEKPPLATDSDNRVVIVHLKGSQEYAAWLDAIHAKNHVPKSTMFRLAMAEWAERNGHPTPPEL